MNTPEIFRIFIITFFNIYIAFTVVSLAIYFLIGGAIGVPISIFILILASIAYIKIRNLPMRKMYIFVYLAINALFFVIFYPIFFYENPPVILAILYFQMSSLFSAILHARIRGEQS